MFEQSFSVLEYWMKTVITELNQVREYDLKENKPVWTKAVNQQIGRAHV